MTCYLCNQAIRPGEEVNQHHPIYKSNGGIDTEPTHQECHVNYHSTNGDFTKWGKEGGKLSALSKRWAFNLLNVRDDPAYQLERQFYLMTYAEAGWSEGLC